MNKINEKIGFYSQSFGLSFSSESFLMGSAILQVFPGEVWQSNDSHSGTWDLHFLSQQFVMLFSYLPPSEGCYRLADADVIIFLGRWLYWLCAWQPW